MLNKIRRFPSSLKIAAVLDYHNRRQSLRAAARNHGVPLSTLWFWIKRHEKLGSEGLEHHRVRTLNFPSKTSIRIMRMKEMNPGLSLRKAQIDLKRRVSLYSIRRTWKEYGLIKNKRSDPLDRFVPETPYLSFALRVVRQEIEKNSLRSAARILNSLPAISRTPLLNRIPEKYLSPLRRLDLLCLDRLTGSQRRLASKARLLSDLLEKKGYRHSSIIADFYQLDALDIIGEPGKKASVLENLAKKMKGIKSYPLGFQYSFEAAFTSVYLLQINRAYQFIKRCRNYVYRLPYPRYWELYGSLLALIGKFKMARVYYEKARSKAIDPEDLGRLSLQIARYAHCYAADYRTCRHMLARLKKENPALANSSAFHLTCAYLNVGEGNLIEARRYFVGSLETAARGSHTNRIYAASAGLAGVAQALGQTKETRTYLRKYLPLLEKNRMSRETLLLKCFIDPEQNLPAELTRTAPFKLLTLLRHAHLTGRTGDYRRTQIFAQSCGLSGLYHRWIVFFPDSVKKLLEKGKDTGLPNSILNYPVFNQKIPVYRLNILGDLTFFKNEIRLKSRLSPKERSFLVHLALRAGAPGKSLEVGSLGRNFWPRASNFSSLLSHMLVKLKKKIRLPGHLLAISARSGPSRLINRGVYLTTDYAELKSLLAQARTLELSGEWRFARREYLRAFALCRGEPFQKTYDDWSEAVRSDMMNFLENEAARFARICRDRGEKKVAKKAAGNAIRAVPGSPVIQGILTV